MGLEKKLITIGGVDYALTIPASEIQKKVKETGMDIINKYREKKHAPIILAISNGGVPFAIDAIRYLDGEGFANEYASIGVEGYGKTEKVGKISVYSHPRVLLFGRDVIILEDLIDTGHSLNFVYKYVKEKQAKSVAVYPVCKKLKHFELDFYISGVPFELPDGWAIGYGMNDKNGFGRGLSGIYVRVESN
ncbi:MAG: phosphoribosyltransferase family protein [Candidatus Falkowbacteria bacterium]|nr:phosphoribosyltransferase family protein [Candidatus Falkowbacteria bacterium]